MIKKITSSFRNLKKIVLATGVIGAVATFMSFSPMFFGPGLSEATPFVAFSDDNFPDLNVSTEPYEVAFENLTFDWPLTFNPVPTQNRIIVGQLNGEIFWIDDNQAANVKNLIVDFSDEVGDAVTPNIEVWDGGLLGLELHPNFGLGGNNYVYIFYTTESETGDDTLSSGGNGTFGCDLEEFHGNYIHLERFELDPANLTFVEGSRDIMIRRRMLNTTHRGGAMVFGDDGFLYVAVGEQGRAISAQNMTENIDGGVLRIDVDMDITKSHAPIRTMPEDVGDAQEITGQNYFIPNDNPFIDNTGEIFEEYYSIGNRSPHRMSKDSQTGSIYLGEVGFSTHDEINVLSSGANYGWPVYEGPADGPFNGCDVDGLLNDMPHQLPLTAFSRDDAGSIIGGYVYRGSEFTAFNGDYITADWLTQKILSVNIATGDVTTLGTLPRRPISFGEDSDGDIYYLTQGNNVQLLRFVEPGVVIGVPQTLTETGAFTDVENLVVADGYLPYELIDPFWSDGAVKKRWMAIPNDGNPNTAAEQIDFSENGVWEFPIGTVLIKHFDYPIDENNSTVLEKVETRFSIKNSNGNWTFLSYKWNTAQDEATLIDMSSGDLKDVEVTLAGGGTETITWQYPSTSECLSCHNEISKGTLGPRTRYLNSEFDYAVQGGIVGNQLVTLSELGFIEENITDGIAEGYLTHTSINDLNGSLDDKARSYLDLNCAYCHQADNNLRADFDLRLANSLIETNLLSATIAEPVEDMAEDQKILFVKDAAKSQIFHRANSLTSGVKMPLVAKNQVDEAGVALLEEWINQLSVPPTPVVSADPVLGNVPLNVNFTGSESSDDESVDLFEWDFGDGNSSTEADPSYTYTEIGVYTATLVVTDNDGQTGTKTIEITVTGGDVNNVADENTNIALANDAIISGQIDGGEGRGIPQDILYDPSKDDYFVATNFNEYGDLRYHNAGTLPVEEALTWRVDWLSKKLVNYVTFGGAFPNQPQPNTAWRLSYRVGNEWTVLEEGIGGWIDDGIYEWGGKAQAPFEVDGFRMQLFSDGTNDLVSAHLRARGGTSLLINDSGENTKATLFQYLTDDGSPVASFDFMADELEVTFDSSESTDDNGIVTYAWDFGDGEVSDEANPVHNYTADGTYDVTLTLTDADGLTDFFTESITVEGIPTIPVAIASSNVTTGPAPLDVQFTGSNSTDDIAIISYVWDFGDGATSIEEDPSYEYTVPGNYLATLTVTDADGNENETTINIVANGGAVDNNANAGINLALLSDASVSGSSVDGKGTPQAILYDPLAENYFVVTDFNEYGVANGENLGTPDADNGFNWQVDWANRKEVNYITFGGVYPNQPQPNSLWRISYRIGDVWTMLEEGAGGWIDAGIYEWGGATMTPIQMDGLRVQVYSNGTNDLVSIHLRGRGGVSNIIDDSATLTKATLIQYLPDTGAPESEFDYASNDLEVTFDSSASTDNVGIVSYTWDFGDGNGSTNPNPIHTYIEEGTYNVTLTVTDENGLSDISAQEIIVTRDNSVPIAIALADIMVGPAPLNVQFSGSTSTDNVGVVTYAWDFGNGNTSNVADPNYTFATSGNYMVTLTVTDADGNTNVDELTILANGGDVDNNPNAGLNIALLPDAVLSGSTNDGRGTPQAILYDPSKDDYFERTDFNEYGVPRGENLGTPGVEDAFLWQVDWANRKDVNYITFGGVFDNQPQPNSLWRISYLVGSEWIILEEGTGGWIDSGIFEWGGSEETPISIDGLRVQIYSDGINDLISIHLRGRGGRSNIINDSASETKATLIQYLPPVGAPESVFEFTVDNLQLDFDSSLSTDDVGIILYEWDFGDGNVSTDANPSNIYPTSGSFTVTLTVTDAEGYSDTSSQVINLGAPANEAPVAEIETSLVTGAAPLTEEFVGSNSTDDVAVVSYEWDFGDGNTSTEIDPTYIYTVAGNYTATLTVTDEQGLTDQVSVSIIVTSDVADNSPNAGVNIALLPDATISSSVENPRGTVQSILYDPSRGDYFVRTNYNEFGEAFGVNLGTPDVDDAFQWQVDWASRKIVNYITFGGVYENQPQPNSLWRISYRVGNDWVILDEGVGGWIDAGIYEWGSSEQAPIQIDGLRVQVYSDGINDVVSVHLRGRGGISNSIDDSATETKATLIQYLPDAGAPESSFDYVINELQVDFDSSASIDDNGIVSYAWDFGDGNSSNEANPVHIYSESGTYDVTLTVTDADGKLDTSAATITVLGNGIPVAVASADVLEGEASLTVSFDGSGSTDDNAVVTYAWDFDDDDISNEINPVHVFDEVGEYTVTLTVSDAEGQTHSTTLTITVNEENEAPIAIASADVIFGEAPQTILFVGSTSTDDVGVVSYAWDFVDGGTSTEADPEYTFSTNGVFEVTLTVTDADGLMDITSLTITVEENIEENEAPVAIATADIIAGEVPLTVSFIGSESTDDVGVISYAWDFVDGGSSTEADTEYTFNTAGEYEVSLIVTDTEGLSDTTTLTITVGESIVENEAPIAIASSDIDSGEAPLTVLFVGSASVDDTEVISYAWDFGDGGTSSEVDPEYIFNTAGVYEVTLTVEDAEGLTDSVTITITVEDNAPLDVELDMVLSPNPSIDYVEITLNGIVSEDDIIGFTLHDSAGRLIRQYLPDEISTNGTYIIDLAILTTDVYVVTVVLNNGELVSKRMILRK
ncbi:PKD domain-containing protein [Maribacter sp. BPC-D8]|uniref:PKD domain-containing protein n=1 Tax=Maribacter sp. BPC-D8 TaxID=3053613 RepID=UPI002B47FE9E|nr:PKD domain-containing protein [Maribacter sp. BPC-D8]WRI31291.1 PKD domain-containing protein [Maribacter sp. BPC-D8]